MKIHLQALCISSVLISIFLSCEEELNTVGEEVISDINFKFDQYAFHPTIGNKLFDRVQTSQLAVNLLGIYNDPTYGTTTYTVLSQINLSKEAADFGKEAVLDSVVFSLPYFSETTGETIALQVNTDPEDINQREDISSKLYTLDSVYGTDPIHLEIYKSNYFLSDIDLESNSRKLYFSDDILNFGTSVESELLYNSANDSRYTNGITISNKEIITKVKTITNGVSKFKVTNLAPQLRIVCKGETNPTIKLFQEAILNNAGKLVLSNNSNFRNFFRGIYFKAIPINPKEGTLVFLDLSKASIDLHYTTKITEAVDPDEPAGETEEVEKQQVFNLQFGNNIINGIANDFEIRSETTDPNTAIENVYLKGGVGAYATIQIFGEDLDSNGIADQIEYIQKNNWLVNQAQLKINVNTKKVVSGSTEPERIFIFNTETARDLLDSRGSLIKYSGNLNPNDKDGRTYTVDLTEHIRGILNGKIENVPLGISVSQNASITQAGIGYCKSNQKTNIPLEFVFSHEGTVIYGTSESIDEDKRIKLEITYTEANTN